MKYLTAAMAILLVTAGVAPAAASGQASGEAYSGANISFDVSESSISNFQVQNEVLLDSVKVQSTSKTESSGGISVGADASAVANIEGSALSMGAQTETSATVQAGGSTEMEAHDNANGILTVNAGDESQVVEAEVGSSAEAESQSDSKVTMTTESGTQASFIVVGDGNVTVNDEGNVAAQLNDDSQLVFRSYSDGKDSNDEEKEDLIESGQAAGEVHVMAQESGETAADAVSYGSEASLEAQQSAESTVDVTVDRAEHEGKVIMTTVAESAIENAENMQVTVDGEAAAQASSYSELESAIGSDQSAYMVTESSAEASADVLVAVNHFSERNIQMTDDGNSSDDSSSTEDDSQEQTTSEDGSGSSGGNAEESDTPGFGVMITLLSLAGALIALREH